MNTKYLLQKELQAYIQDTIPAGSMRNQLYQALSVPGKVLASDFDSHGGWAIFCQTMAFEVASDALTERQQQVVCRTALAVECLICALDIIDDLQDDDSSPLLEKLGISTNRSQAQANAQSITVVLQMVVTPGLLLSLHNAGVDAELLFKLMDMMNKAVLTAVQGQELDLAWEDFSLQQVTQEHIATMMAYKSGSLMAMACAMSVIAAGITDSEFVHKCMLFGTFLGMRSQLRNDMRDLHNPQKSDVRREKKTLPIFFSKRTHEVIDEKGLQDRLLYIDTALSSLLSSLLYDLELSQQIKFAKLRKMLGLSLPSQDEAN